MAIVDDTGTLVAQYEYDSFGKTTVKDASGSIPSSNLFVGNINPFRWKSFYYDVETNFYYANGRYYEVERGGYIDAIEADVVEGNAYSLLGLDRNGIMLLTLLMLAPYSETIATALQLYADPTYNLNTGEEESWWKKHWWEVLVSAVSIVVGVVKIVTGNPTGKTEGIKCSRCNEVLKEQTVIPAKGHTVVEVKGVDATCTEAGKTSGSMCSACGKVYSTQEDVPALGHVDANSDGACDRCGYTNPDMMFSLFQKDETYTEQAVNVGEKIAGSYYRIYKDQGDPEESGYAYPNSIYVYWGDIQVKLGFGAATGQTATGSLDLYSKLVEANFIYRDYDDYVDFYIPAGNYQLGLGPYNKETCDPDGNGYFDLTIDSETTIAGVNGENKCFRLVLNSGV